MIRLYGVLDTDGTKINTITADEDAVNDGWYPGYGAALIDEGENPADPPPVISLGKPDTWTVLAALAEPMTVGDKIDLKSGKVTKAEVIAVAVEVEIKP